MEKVVSCGLIIDHDTPARALIKIFIIERLVL